MSDEPTTNYEAWLRSMGERAGKGSVDRVDARSLVKAADLIRDLQAELDALKRDRCCATDPPENSRPVIAEYQHDGEPEIFRYYGDSYEWDDFEGSRFALDRVNGWRWWPLPGGE